MRQNCWKTTPIISAINTVNSTHTPISSIYAFHVTFTTIVVIHKRIYTRAHTHTHINFISDITNTRSMHLVSKVFAVKLHKAQLHSTIFTPASLQVILLFLVIFNNRLDAISEELYILWGHKAEYWISFYRLKKFQNI